MFLSTLKSKYESKTQEENEKRQQRQELINLVNKNYNKVIQEHNISKRNRTCTTIVNPSFFPFNIEKGYIGWYVWVENNSLMLIPDDVSYNTSFQVSNFQREGLSDDTILSFYTIQEIPINDIEYFKCGGEVHYEDKIIGTGGGANIGGAIVGGIIAGGVGAIVGGRQAIDIKSEHVKHDDRRVTLKSKTRLLVIDNSTNAFDILNELFPEKEYGFIQEKKRQELIGVSYPVATSATVNLSIPDQIRELAKLKEEGILTEDEFTAKKAELLGKM